MSEMSCACYEELFSLEEFLNDLELNTGVSRRFLDAARPILTKLFTDVPASRRPEVAAQVRNMMARRAIEEDRFEVALSRLEMNEGEPDEPVCSAEAASVYLLTYGGFGKPVTVLA